MAVEGYQCPLDPETGSTLWLYLYKKVQNVEEIRKNVMRGSWQCAIIKPSLIIHPFQVAVAANKAVLAQHDGSMTTRSLFSEILFNLSLTKNISRSLTKFGIENDTNILVAFVDAGDAEERSTVLPQIHGEPCPIADLGLFADLKSIKKAYKLERVECESDEELLDLIVSKMATKTFVSY